MKQRLYALHHYTEAGDLKAPPFLLFILIFLSRTWALLIISVVSRETGNELLQIFYPEKLHFYLGLAVGLLPIIIFIVSGRRHAQNKWALKCWPFCFYFLVMGMLSDIALQVYYLIAMHFQYSISASIQLVFAAWSCIYIFKSKQLQDCFKASLIK